MSIKYICDVCESEFAPHDWERTDAIFMVYPRSTVGDLGEDDRDAQMHACSWECVHSFASQVIGPYKEASPAHEHHAHEHHPHIHHDHDVNDSGDEDVDEPGHRMVRLKSFDTSKEMPDKSFDPRQNTVPGLKVDGRPV